MKTRIAILWLLFPWAARDALPAVETPPLEISHRARSLQPGEVVLVTARGRRSLTELSGTIFETTFFFFPAPDARTWSGLIGIDLETSAGIHELLLRGRTAEGLRVESRHPLRIEEKKFPTRRITVDEKFVNPPADVLDRIREESRRIRAIFAAASDSRLWQGTFQPPVPGSTTSGFGRRSILNGKPRSPHSGTDFRAREGTPVQAPNTGVVVLAEELYYSGNTVILDHGLGLFSYFAHLSRFAIRSGEKVRAGELVGYVGASGRVTGPHLHWSVRLSGTRVDPLSLMSVLAENAGD